MRNQYKILAEKYSLVKEDSKEDIMAGLNVAREEGKVFEIVYKYTNLVKEIKNKLIRKGVIDHDDDDNYWVYRNNYLPRTITTQFTKDIIEIAKSKGWSPRPGSPIVHGHGFKRGYGKQKDIMSFQNVIGEWLHSVQEFTTFDEWHDINGAVEMLNEIINDALIHKYDFEY